MSGPSRSDLIAGASVAVIVIPQALAYADLAGVPARHGLLAAALPAVLAAPFVSSRFLQTGPVALTALLAYGALADRAAPFSPEYIRLAALLAVLVGAVRAALGLARLGGLAYLLSEPVLTGFTSGAAILIIASQFPKLLGLSGGDGGVLANALDAARSVGDWHAGAIAFAAGTAVIVMMGRRLHPAFPGVLLAVIGGLLVSRLSGYGGPTVGEVPSGFVTLDLDLPWSSIPALLPSAILIGLIGFAEPSSIARHFAALERERWDPNRELVGQGVANMASGFTGGFPIGGSFSRTSINHATGATSAWSGAVTGAVVAVALPLTPVLATVPTAVLGALIIVGVAKLIDLRGLARLLRPSPAQAAVGFGTLAATLLLAPRVELGVVVGIVLAVAVHLYRELTGVTVEHELHGDRLLIRPRGVLWFATVLRVETRLLDVLADHPDIERLAVDLSGVGRLDYSGAAALERALADVRAAGIEVEIDDIPPGARRAAGIHLDIATRISCSAHGGDRRTGSAPPVRGPRGSS